LREVSARTPASPIRARSMQDWLDDRKARKAFLNAIRVELSAIRGHLEETLKDTTENKERLEKGGAPRRAPCHCLP
jgi:hypothetical protein